MIFFVDSHRVLLVRGWNFAHFLLWFPVLFFSCSNRLYHVFWHRGRVLLPTGRFRNDIRPSFEFLEQCLPTDFWNYVLFL